MSKAGKRRGRGKGAGRRMAKDLNKGQIIGVGQINMVWPGLNAPIIRGREVVQQKKLPQDKNYLVNLLKVRNEMDTYRRFKQHPLERGWSGAKMHGRSIGPPDVNPEIPEMSDAFDGFDSRVLMVRAMNTMKRGVGRTRLVIAMVVTGNNNGLGGFMVVQGKEAKAVMNKAKNQASQRLRFIERDLSSNTIVHDFVSRYGCVQVYAYKKPNGYGVVAHRCIKAICDVIGIDNIYCKVEGPVKNYLYVTKAFFLGLCEQRSFQALADEKQLHVVEMREENDFFPKIMASPSNGIVRSAHEIDADEITDFRMYLNNGEVIDVQPHKYPEWVRTQGFVKYLRKWQMMNKNRQENRVYLKAKYGQLDSFLTIREKEERAQRKAALALKQEDQSKEEQPDEQPSTTLT